MTRFDRRFIAVILAPLPPILLFLTGWWVSFLFLKENPAFIAAFIGLTLGILLDIRYLGRWVNGAFQMRMSLWLLVYGFYSVCFFGFFMGVPVFNLFLGIPVGVFIVRQAKMLKCTQGNTNKRIEAASRISALYMVFICFSSAVIALVDPYTANNLEGMFNLSFEVTREMIGCLILAGGIALIIIQYAITKFSAYHFNAVCNNLVDR